MSSKSVPEVPVKVVFTTETVSDTDKVEQKDNMHNMPKIDISHKACGVANCMSCAFNVMYVYFNSKHASSDKTAPHQHMNNKMHVRAKAVPVKHLNNMKHSKEKGVSPQQMNQVNSVKSKTVSPPKTIGWKLFYPSLNRNLLRMSTRSIVQSMKRSVFFRTRLLVPLRKGRRHLYLSLNKNLLRLLIR